MRRRRKFAITGVIGIATIAVGVFTVQAASGRAEAMMATAVTATITIDPAYGATFAPPPANAASTAALTAQQAWTQFIQQASGSSNTAIPSTVTTQLGLFTLPVGPDCGATCSDLPLQAGISYTALNELAYGYRWPGDTCPSGSGVTSLPAIPCTEWIFIDANTGHMIVWMSQYQAS